MKAWAALLYVEESLFKCLRQYAPPLYNVVNMLSLFSTALLRFTFGSTAIPNIESYKRPTAPLILYEFEGCPYCKVVREVLSVLDLDYTVFPCPRTTLKAGGIIGDSRFRPALQKIAGKVQFPYLEDPTNGTKLFESSKIIEYLYKEYGAKPTSLSYRLADSSIGRFILFTVLPFARPCLDMGMAKVESKKPDKLLELWGSEPSPFVKLVREKLCSLEIPYTMHTLPYGSTKRQAFAKEHQQDISDIRKSLNLVKVPYLKDANTNTAMFESGDIIKYLQKTYQISDYPKECWLDYGTGVPQPEPSKE